MKNFPFKHNGAEYWYSRAVVASAFVYAKYNGQWYVLADQRGPSLNAAGLWNAPGGFVDHGETVRDAAVREVREETGVEIPYSKMRLANIRSIPAGKLQHIIFSYVVNLGKVDKLPETSDLLNEPGETIDIMWVPMNGIHHANWLSGHLFQITTLFNTYINPTLIQRIKNLFYQPVENAYTFR